MASTASMSPLVQLLEGVHGKQRERIDEAMAQIRALLKLSPSDRLDMDGTPDRLCNIVRLVLSRIPELACVVNPDDGSLPLHHAASLGDIAVTELLLSTVRATASNGACM